MLLIRPRDMRSTINCNVDHRVLVQCICLVLLADAQSQSPVFFNISGAKCMFMVRPRDMRSKTYSNVGSRVLVQCIHLAYLTDAHCQSPV